MKPNKPIKKNQPTKKTTTNQTKPPPDISFGRKTPGFLHKESKAEGPKIHERLFFDKLQQIPYHSVLRICLSTVEELIA